VTTPTHIDAILAEMKPEEVHGCLWMINVFERSNMPPDEANEWRRRILARQRFMQVGSNSSADYIATQFLPPH
jgi:hypothetical protein